MRKPIALALAATLLSFTGAYAQQESQKTETKAPAWIDMANCEICQNFAFMEKEMMNIQWDTYIIHNGLMSISVMPEELGKKMAEAKKAMQKTIARIEGGEEVKCCPFCQSMGSMLGQGARMEEFTTIAGEVQLITSDNPEVVKQIHAHAKKTIEYHKTMKKESAHEHGGEHGEHGEHAGQAEHPEQTKKSGGQR